MSFTGKYGNEMNSVAEVDFFTDAMKNQQIRTLNLSKSVHLSDVFLKFIVLACPDMELLNISSTYGTTEKGIAKVLKICHGMIVVIFWIYVQDIPKLEVLTVARSGFSDKGMEKISRRCPGLLKLDLKDCVGVTTKRVEELVRELECRIL